MSCDFNDRQSCARCADENGQCGLVALNDALQRACPVGCWVYWRGGTAHVANSHASTELGTADEPLEELIARIPDMCEMVDALKADKMERRGC